MKFKILFIFIFTVLISLVCSGSIDYEVSELKVISAKLEKEVIRQGESTTVTVAVKNAGDSPIHDISFFLRLSNSDVDDIKIKEYDQKENIGDFTDYYIDATDTALDPGKTKNAVYVINTSAAKKEKYILRVGAEGWKQTNEVQFLWPRCVGASKIYLNIELIELPPEHYLEKAEEYLKSGSYENAGYYAEKAKEIYINSGNAEGALNCDKIILQSEKMLEAEVAYKRAKNRMDEGDFRGIISNAESSIKIYNEIDSYLISDKVLELISGRVSELKLMIEETNKKIAAWEYFSNATRYLESGDYKKAKEYAEKAKEIYLELDDSIFVLKCNSIINRSELNASRNALILNIGYVIGIIILLLFIFIFYRKSR